MSNEEFFKYRLERADELRLVSHEGVRLLDWETDFDVIHRYYADKLGMPDITRDPVKFARIKEVALLVDGQIVSFAIIYKMQKGDWDICDIHEDEWEIGDVSTAPDERNKGYARAVVAAAVEYTLEHGRCASLTTHHDNVPMQKAAEAIGMKRVKGHADTAMSAGAGAAEDTRAETDR